MASLNNMTEEELMEARLDQIEHGEPNQILTEDLRRFIEKEARKQNERIAYEAATRGVCWFCETPKVNQQGLCGHCYRFGK